MELDMCMCLCLKLHSMTCLKVEKGIYIINEDTKFDTLSSIIFLSMKLLNGFLPLYDSVCFQLMCSTTLFGFFLLQLMHYNDIANQH